MPFEMVNVPGPGPVLDEWIARAIARALGHNDEHGMYWEQYILAAKKISEEFDVTPRHDVIKDKNGRIA